MKKTMLSRGMAAIMAVIMLVTIIPQNTYAGNEVTAESEVTLEELAAQVVLPEKVKEEKSIELPQSYTYKGVTATIFWEEDKPAVSDDDDDWYDSYDFDYFACTFTAAAKKPVGSAKESLKNIKITIPYSDTRETKLKATFTAEGKSEFTKEYKITAYSKKAAEEDEIREAHPTLYAAYKSLNSVMNPKYGVDTNINTYVEKLLEKKGYKGIRVSVVSSEIVSNMDGGSIDNDGTIHYYYKDPETTASQKQAQSEVVFCLTDGNDSMDLTQKVNIPWDEGKVREQMEKDVISKVDAAIPAETDSDFEIPGSIENISYTDISVTSSDKAVVELKAGEYDYNTWKKKPTKAIVKQGTEAKQVTLTATFKFNRTDYSSTILFTKDYTVTVKPKSAEQYEAIRQELVKEIEEGINKYKFTDSVTGEELKKDGDAYVTTEDIQLPKPSRLGGNGSARPVWLSVDDVTYAKDPSGQKNARKVDILRPGVGKEDGIFHLTITVDDSKDSGVIASKTYTFKIKALTQKELGDELTLMKTVKEHYFDGIKGENVSATEITSNLHNFREAWFDENQSLAWVYDSKYDKSHGIMPDDITGYDSMGSQKWRTFRTSNESVIAPENLLVTRQKEHTRVKIDSELTSKTFGKYGELYLKDSVKYSEYKDFAALYKQPVSVTVVVLGTNPTKELAPEEPVSEDNTSGEKKQEETKIRASFTLKGLDGETLIANTSVSDLQNGTTAFDVLAKVFKENGYDYIGSGYYIEGVKKSDGSTLYEKDAGKNSGWMYRVNGHLPDVSIGNYVLSDGDNIEFFFVNDYNNLFTKDGKEIPVSEVKDEASSAEKKEEEKKEDAKVERQEVKNEDGTTTVTEKVETTKETKLEIVTKDESGKAQKTIEITVPKDTTKTPEAEVTQVVPKKEKLKISEDVAKEIQKNADSKKVEVTLRVNDDKGKEKYTVTTTAQNLANEEELFLYKLDEKGNKVLVNSKTYKKDEDGNFAVSVKTKGDYILCNAKEAKQVEKAILKTVQPEKKSVTVASDQKITMNLSKKLDMDNVKSIKYVSTKKSVAKVSKNGKITAQHAGTVKIKAIVTLNNGEKKTVVMKVKVKKDRKK